MICRLVVMRHPLSALLGTPGQAMRGEFPGGSRIFIAHRCLLHHPVHSAWPRESVRVRERHAAISHVAILLYYRAGLAATVRQKVTPLAAADAIARS